MRLLALLLCGLPLYAADLSRLLQLEQKNRAFDLRRALQQSGSAEAETLFYRAVVSARFGDEEAGIGGLQRFLATSPDPELARKAWEELALPRRGSGVTVRRPKHSRRRSMPLSAM